MSTPELRARLARERRLRQAPPTPWADRLGPAVLGLFGGLVVGLVVGLVLQSGHPGTTRVAAGAFSGAALGALLGALSADFAFGLFEGLVHLVAGMATGVASGVREEAEEQLRPAESAPRWLRVVFLLGIVLALVAVVALRWH